MGREKKWLVLQYTEGKKKGPRGEEPAIRFVRASSEWVPQKKRLFHREKRHRGWSYPPAKTWQKKKKAINRSYKRESLGPPRNEEKSRERGKDFRGTMTLPRIIRVGGGGKKTARMQPGTLGEVFSEGALDQGGGWDKRGITRTITYQSSF